MIPFSSSSDIEIAAASAEAATDMSLAGITSSNLEWVRTVPIGASSPSGRKVGDYFYTTDWARGLVIFDVSKPEEPRQVGSLLLPHIVENEDIATNGEIALISQLGAEHYLHPPDVVAEQPHPPNVSRLNVVDVSDKASPELIATLDGAGDHTYECLYHCTWAYGAVSGHIVDLRIPNDPKLSGANWHADLGLFQPAPAHDVFEVEPGLVLTGSLPFDMLLDVKDPEKPLKLAQSASTADPSYHQVHWPNKGQDRFMLGGNEADFGSLNARCEVTEKYNENPLLPRQIGFQTWDASTAKKGDDFKLLDNYLPENGYYVDGDPAVSAGGIGANGGCSAHYFDPHPDFKDGGFVAHSTWGHGMKVLNVGSDGTIDDKAVAFFLPYVGDTLSAYWITSRIIYAVDAQRGIDVLRYVGELP